MKAGILTFHEADNYGAVLQAYALQTVLGQLGVDSKFISFANGQNRPSSAPASLFARKLWEEQTKRVALFERFRRERLVCAQSVSKERSGELDSQYDVFIAGSDQIWNFRIPGMDERYFLPFASREKRISYAASFGMGNIPDERRSWYTCRLRDFRAISVREKRGQGMVRELTGRECAVCLDPVLLLERQDWETFSAVEERAPYVFLHMVQFDGLLLARAKMFAEENGLELCIATAGYVPQCGYSAWNGTGVEAWVGMIRNAAYVFTNSFHGAAFSLIFGRPVISAALQEGLGERNGRIAELFQCAGVENCLNGFPKALPAETFAQRIDELKRRSMDYLRDTVVLGGTGAV